MFRIQGVKDSRVRGIKIRQLINVWEDTGKVKSMLKVLIISSENKHLTPCPLESLNPFFY